MDVVVVFVWLGNYIDSVLLLFLLRQRAPVTATGNAQAALGANNKELAAIAATELRAKGHGQCELGTSGCLCELSVWR